MRQVIALAGVGNLGRYLFEEFIADERYDVVVISRKKSVWLQDQKADVRITDFTEESVRTILDSTKSTVLISLLNPPVPLYLDIHRALLNACTKSQTCKRLIPSEWIGNSEEYPLLPRFYGVSREPFRKLLRKSEIQWTLFNGGWLMDYFLPKEKTYMPPIPDEFPVDPNNWQACIRGSGNELQSFTSARDIARAVVELMASTDWDTVTYVTGEWSTFNEVVTRMETLKGKRMKISYKSEHEIMDFIGNQVEKEMTHEMEIALVEEWMMAGASACPREKTLLHRDKYFQNMKFSTLEEFLKAADVDFI